MRANCARPTLSFTQHILPWNTHMTPRGLQSTRNLHRIPEQWREGQRLTRGPLRHISEVPLANRLLLNPPRNPGAPARARVCECGCASVSAHMCMSVHQAALPLTWAKSAVVCSSTSSTGALATPWTSGYPGAL